MIEDIHSAAQEMLQAFEKTKKIPHRGIKGRARESEVVEKLLRPYLPQKYSIGTGLILDIDNIYSNQQDILIYDGINIPLWKNLGEDKLLFPESVYAAIEVKSNIDKTAIEDIVEKHDNIRKLRMSVRPLINLTNNLAISSMPNAISCLGFGFNSILTIEKIKDIFNAIRNERNSYSTNFITILSDKNKEAGVIGYVAKQNINYILPTPQNDSIVAMFKFKDPGGALIFTYLMLMENLQHIGLINPIPNYAEYANKSQLMQFGGTIDRSSLKGAKVVNDGGYAMDIDAGYKCQELYEKIKKNEPLNKFEAAELFYYLVVTSGDPELLNETELAIESTTIKDFTPLELFNSCENFINNRHDSHDENIIDKYYEYFKNVENGEYPLHVWQLINRKPIDIIDLENPPGLVIIISKEKIIMNKRVKQ